MGVARRQAIAHALASSGIAAQMRGVSSLGRHSPRLPKLRA
jgi:hypothetical protein